MSKSEDTIRILRTATCRTLSGKSNLKYQLLANSDNEIHIRITENSGGGFFSKENLSMNDIKAVLDEHPEGTPVTSFILQPLFHGKSVNTPAFLLAALVHERLLYPMKGKKRGLEVVDPEDFAAIVDKLTSSKPRSKATTRKSTGDTAVKTTKKAVTKKTVSRKAAVKKKSTARKKTARTV